MKTYMIIEYFLPGKARELYERFEKQGRLLPEGVRYVNSWIDEHVTKCYQVMESPSVDLLHEWISNWDDLATFHIVPVIASNQAKMIALAETVQTKGLSIRLADKDDREAIAGLLLVSFAAYQHLYTQQAFEATVIDPEEAGHRMTEGPIWLVEDNNKMLGTISVVPSNNQVYIRGMAVHPTARKQGIGLQLLRKVERFAQQQNSDRLYLSTTPYLRRAIHLYQRFGFRIVNEGPFHLHQTPLFTMEKKLKQD